MAQRGASDLVTSGPFRGSSNSIYVGHVTILAGPIIDALAIRREEAHLLRQFSTDYLAYCKSVRRWL